MFCQTISELSANQGFKPTIVQPIFELKTDDVNKIFKAVKYVTCRACLHVFIKRSKFPYKKGFGTNFLIDYLFVCFSMVSFI